nr:MAG TPA: hypothetical protein [Caudoviricetes sp.]
MKRILLAIKSQKSLMAIQFLKILIMKGSMLVLFLKLVLILQLLLIACRLVLIQ